jgi:hypothetical protein
MPITHWLHYADHRMAPICRSLTFAEVDLQLLAGGGLESDRGDLGCAKRAPKRGHGSLDCAQ